MSELGNLVEMADSLSFENNAFTSDLPTELGRLSQLKSYFDVSRNKFASIPTGAGAAAPHWTFYTPHLHPPPHPFTLTPSLPSSELGNLDKMISWFDLAEVNALPCPIPTELGRLRKIDSRLRLPYGVFSSTIPTELGNLEQMTYDLDLDSNDLRGTLPSELGKLPISSDVYFTSNQLTSSIPTQFGQLTTMSNDFGFDSNSLSSTLPTELGQLTILSRFFDLSSNR